MIVAAKADSAFAWRGDLATGVVEPSSDAINWSTSLGARSNNDAATRPAVGVEDVEASCAARSRARSKPRANRTPTSLIALPSASARRAVRSRAALAWS